MVSAVIGLLPDASAEPDGGIVVVVLELDEPFILNAFKQISRASPVLIFANSWQMRVRIRRDFRTESRLTGLWEFDVDGQDQSARRKFMSCNFSKSAMYMYI